MEDVHSKLLNDFVDSSNVLAMKGLFPESLTITEIDESDRLPDLEYADALFELHRLYKKCYELDVKVCFHPPEN